MSEYQTIRPCVICGTKDNQPYCSIDGLVYVRCDHCRLIYVDNFADNAKMYGAYTGGGFKSFRRKLFAPIRKMHNFKGYRHFSQRAKQILAAALQHVSNDKDRSYLDIGCNKGFLLAAGIETGCDVHGVELVKELIRPFCNTYPQYAHQVYSDKFQDVARRFSDRYFDLVTAIDVIEHFEDPLSDLREVHRILKDDGAFVIQTPDSDCSQATSLGCNWGALKPLEHLHVFGRDNFITFGKKAGFAEVLVSDPFEEADGNFVAVLKK